MSDDPTKIDADIAKAIREASDEPRGIADFFDWPTKAAKEKFVVRTALEMAEISVSELSSRGDDDPPDCQGLLAGELIGIEATELVSKEMIEQFKLDGIRVWKEWSKDSFLALLKNRIAEKDSKTLKGGPYSKYFLVVFTDEFVLHKEAVQTYLAGFVPEGRQLDEVLLLISYDPRTQTYPLFRLPVQKK